MLKCIFNILKQVSKGKKIQFRVRGRGEGTFGALQLHCMINQVSLISHKILAACFTSSFVTDGTIAYSQKVTFLCYVLQFRSLNKKCRAVKISTPIGLCQMGVRILISEPLKVRGIKCKFLEFSGKVAPDCTTLVRN